MGYSLSALGQNQHKTAIYADLEALPPHVVGEIIDGELIVSPRPAPRHAHASSRLGGVLDGPFYRGSGGPGGWIILDEPELHHQEDVLVPDLAGWRRERLPTLPHGAYFELAPDWICEVLSPSTETVDRARKMRIYAREAVQHVWLINPINRTLEVFRLSDGSWLLAATLHSEGAARIEPFEAIELDVTSLWAD